MTPLCDSGGGGSQDMCAVVFVTVPSRKFIGGFSGAEKWDKYNYVAMTWSQLWSWKNRDTRYNFTEWDIFLLKSETSIFHNFSGAAYATCNNYPKIW